MPEYETADLGFLFKSEYWGKGYATEGAAACVKYGFDILKLEKIMALAVPENTASIHVLNKLNFQFEKDVMDDGALAKQFVLMNIL